MFDYQDMESNLLPCQSPSTDKVSRHLPDKLNSQHPLSGYLEPLAGCRLKGSNRHQNSNAVSDPETNYQIVLLLRIVNLLHPEPLGPGVEGEPEFTIFGFRLGLAQAVRCRGLAMRIRSRFESFGCMRGAKLCYYKL